MYAICTAIAAISMAVLAPISDVLLPELADLHDRRAWDAFHQRFAGVQRVVFGVAGGVALVCLIFPSEALRLATSVNCPSGAITLRFLGLQGILASITFLYGLILSVRLRVWGKTSIAIVAGLLTVLLDLWLVPRFGLPAAAFAQTSTAAVGLCLTVVLTWDMFSQSIEPLELMRLSAAFGLVAALRLFFIPSELTFVSAAARLIIGVSGYFFMLLATGYISYRELRSLRRSLR